MKPLLAAQTNFASGLKKRIFLLTDGDVDDRDQVILAAKEHSNKIRVFSFGLGSGCDEHLVREVARAGRGTSTLVQDGGADLNG